MTSLIFALYFFSVYLGCCAQSTRGVWLTTFDPQIQSVSELQTLFTLFKSEGINRIQVSVWWEGFLYAKSQTLENFTGQQSDDYLMNVITAVKNIGGGIDVIAWFQYANMAQQNGIFGRFATLAYQKGWILNEGQVSYGFTWCDPSHKEFQNFFVNMIDQVNENYQQYQPIYQGIQLDDHFAWPTELPGPSAQFRIDTMNEFVLQLMGKISPDYFSLAPNIMSYSLQQFSVDWPLWISNGWVYEIVVQLYRLNYNDYYNTFMSQLTYSKYFKLDQFVAGMMCNNDVGGLNTWQDVNDMIYLSESKGIKGLSVWYAKCIYKDYLDNFRNLWDQSGINNNPILSH